LIGKLAVRLTKYLENQSKFVLITLGLLLLLLIAGIDALISPDVSLSIFYLIPISFTTWYLGEAAGIWISIASAIAWFIANEVIGQSTHSHPGIPYWNAAVRFGFYLVTTYLLSELRSSRDREKKLARTDSITGIANQRLFDELTNLEIQRSSRYGHPITLAFIDIDNFKGVNDKLGHKIGDKILQEVAQTIYGNIRATDIIARLGGDEFALLLPGTGYEPSQIVVERVQKQLVETVEYHQWPVSFSIVAITFMSAPKSVDEMIEKVDFLMYTLKNSGKNRIEHNVEY
jgi:diguanylate cyclase (GGDEF)-like protein